MLVLVVDDDEAMRRVTCRVLQRAGVAVETIDGGAAALARLASGGVDVIVTDYLMPTMTGLELAARARAIAPTTRVVILSGTLPPEDRDVSIPWLGKPLDGARLLAALTADP